MFRRSLYILAAALLFLCGTAADTRAQQDPSDDEAVRQVFFSTRRDSPKSSGTSGKSSTSGRTGTTKSTRPSSGKKGSTTGTTTAGKTQTSTGAADTQAGSSFKPTTGASNAQSIGLGYTLYMRAADGGAIRVDPSRTFSAGDQIRVVVESNTDGHLYIFHTEDGNNPQMLFPDVRLNRGENTIRAHVPYQVPASLNDWFKFDENPATERLFIVLTRQPMRGVPTGEELVKFVRFQLSTSNTTAEAVAAQCRSTPQHCVWRPTPDIWTEIVSAASRQTAVAQSKDAGRRETPVEVEAKTRGLGLSVAEPAPSVIRISATSNTGMLVTPIDLIHR